MKPHWPLVLMVLALLLGLACEDDSTDPIIGSQAPAIPPPSSPENLIAALEVIYSDSVRSAVERRNAFEHLLLPADWPTGRFRFNFQPADVGTDPGGTGVPIPPDWGRAEEIAAHERLFTAQESGEIFSLELDILYGDAQEINPPEAGKENWKRIFASNVFLRLMFNENDGLEVNGGQAEFDCAPSGDPVERWYIGEWTDLPRPFMPGQSTEEVEAATWGGIKTILK